MPRSRPRSAVTISIVSSPIAAARRSLRRISWRCLLVERGQVLVPVGARHGHHRADVLDLARHAPAGRLASAMRARARPGPGRSGAAGAGRRVPGSSPCAGRRQRCLPARRPPPACRPGRRGWSRSRRGSWRRNRSTRRVGASARVAAHQWHDRARRVRRSSPAPVATRYCSSRRVAVRVPPRAVECPAREGSRGRRRGEEAVPVGALDRGERHVAQRQVRRSGHQWGGRGRGQQSQTI